MNGREDRIDSVVAEDKVIGELRRVYDMQGKVLSILLTINDVAKNMKFGTGFKEGFEAVKNATSGLQELNKAKAEAIAAESALKQAVLDSKVTQQGYKEQVEAIRLAEARARDEKRKAKDAIVAEKGSIIDLRNELRKLQSQWDAMGPASRKANAQVLSDIKRVDTELKKLEGQTGRFQRNVGNYPQLVGGLSGLLGTFGVAVGSGAVAKEVFDTTVKLDSLNAALKVVSGTEKEYAINQQFLIDTSERLGLNILDLTKAYKLFYASSTQAGLSADETRRIFNSVSEVSANLKLSQEDTNGVLLAFSQILGKGKVQAEELRGQIGERVPGAFAIAARSIGVTGQELNKMLEKGEVMAADFLPRFARELEKTFGVDNEVRVEGLQASINRLSNTFSALVSNNQSGLAKFFSGIINFLTETLQGFDIFIGKVERVYEVLSSPPREFFFGKSKGKSISEQLLDEMGVLKDANNSVVKDFIAKDSAEQQKLINAYIANAKASQKEYRDTVAQFGKTSEEARKAALRLIQDKDLLDKLNSTLRGEPLTTSSGKGQTKAEINAAARLREAQLKAELEIRKIDLQSAIDSQKDIVDNDKASFADRMAAAENYYNLKNILAKEDATTQKKVLDEEIKLGKAVAEQKTAVDKKYEGERVKNTRELGKILTDILKDNADKETRAILNASEQRQAAIAEAEDAELSRITELYNQGILSRDQFEAAQLQIQNKYANESLNAEIEYIQQLIELKKLRDEPTEDLEKKLAELQNKIRDENLKFDEQRQKQEYENHKTYLEKRVELEKQYADRIKDIRGEVYDFALAVGNSLFEREKNELQDRINLIDEQKQKEIEAVNNSTQSEQQKADQIAIINATSQARKEALERRQREVDSKAAQFQKFMALLQIGITTAESVFKIQAQAAVLSSSIVTAPLAALAYAQIPIVIAAGALQAAAVAAKPIPRYKDGRADGPAEIAVTGDGGVPEVITSPDGRAWVTPNRDTLTYLPEHYKVHPSIDAYMQAAQWQAFKPLPIVEDRAVGDKWLASEIVNGVGKVADAVSKRPSERTILTEKGFQKQVHTGLEWETYLNRYV